MGTNAFRYNMNTNGEGEICRNSMYRPHAFAHQHLHCRGDKIWQPNQWQPKHPWAQFMLCHTPFSSPFLAPADTHSQQCSIVDGSGTTEPLFREDELHECQNGTFPLRLMPRTHRGPTTSSQWHGMICEWVEGGVQQRKLLLAHRSSAETKC